MSKIKRPSNLVSGGLDSVKNFLDATHSLSAGDIDRESIDMSYLILSQTLETGNEFKFRDKARELYEEAIRFGIDEKAAAYNLGMAAGKIVSDAEIADVSPEEVSEYIGKGIYRSRERSINQARLEKIVEKGMKDYRAYSDFDEQLSS